MASYNSVAVIGAGAWGTALAGVAARAGRDVVLYAREASSAAEIASTRANPKLAGAHRARHRVRPARRQLPARCPTRRRRSRLRI